MTAFTLPPDLVAWLSEQAKARNVSRSEFAAESLQRSREDTGKDAGDVLAKLRSVTVPGGKAEPRALALPTSSWLQLEGRSERERRPIGLVAAELLALGMAAADILARQEPGS